MDRKTKEAVRYLGYGSHAVDDDTLALINSSFGELDQTAGKRIVYRIFDVSFKDESNLEIGALKVCSENLGRNLRNCEKAVLLGATLGAGVDLLLRRYSLTNMARAVVLQACAAALLEEYLDCWQEELRREQEEAGFFLRPRFSPGYGDFSICHQQEILGVLEASKKIGVSLTDGNMLTPTKSVTAVIGLCRERMPCRIEGCAGCGKKDCAYRRKGTDE